MYRVSDVCDVVWCEKFSKCTKCLPGIGVRVDMLYCSSVDVAVVWCVWAINIHCAIVTTDDTSAPP